MRQPAYGATWHRLLLCIDSWTLKLSSLYNIQNLFLADTTNSAVKYNCQKKHENEIQTGFEHCIIIELLFNTIQVCESMQRSCQCKTFNYIPLGGEHYLCVAQHKVV